jgi:hypothetical protein
MSNAGDDSEGPRIKGLGWRQGSIVPPELAGQISEAAKLPAMDPAQDLVIVVSHDCDVTHNSLSDEPHVELLLAKLRPETTVDGSLRHGRNPRRLQFRVRVGGEVRLAEARGHERILVDRQELLGHRPDPRRVLDGGAPGEIANWLAKRYIRAAFPDAFEQRIRPSKKAVRKALKSDGEDIQAIWIAADSWDELPEGSSYHILIVATMADTDFGDEAKRKKAWVALGKVEAKLHDCDGVVIEDATLKNETEVTLDDVRSMRRFDFDYLSSDEP